MKVVPSQKEFDINLTLIIIEEDQLLNVLASKQRFFKVCDKSNDKYELKVNHELKKVDANSSIIDFNYTISNKDENLDEKYYLNIGMTIDDRIMLIFLQDDQNKIIRLCVRYACVSYIENTLDKSNQFYKVNPKIDMTNFKSILPTLSMIRHTCEKPITYQNKNGKDVYSKCNKIEGILQIFHINNVFSWQRPENTNYNLIAISFKSMLEELTGKVIDKSILEKDVNANNSISLNFQNKNEKIEQFKNFVQDIIKKIWKDSNPIVHMQEVTIDGSGIPSDKTDHNKAAATRPLIYMKCVDENEDEENENDEENDEQPDECFEEHVIKADPINSNICRSCSSFHSCLLIQALYLNGMNFRQAQSIASFLSTLDDDDFENAFLNISVNKDGHTLVLNFKNEHINDTEDDD